MTHYLVRVGLVFGVVLPAVLFASIVLAQSVTRGVIVFFMIWGAAGVGVRLPEGFFSPTGGTVGADT